jgi:hypothetical protein
MSGLQIRISDLRISIPEFCVQHCGGYSHEKVNLLQNMCNRQNLNPDFSIIAIFRGIILFFFLRIHVIVERTKLKCGEHCSVSRRSSRRARTFRGGGGGAHVCDFRQGRVARWRRT